jgi:hypothetical protein
MLALTLKTTLLYNRRYYDITISGAQSAVEDAVKEIDKKRLDYYMDYSDYEDHCNGQATACFIVHRQDFREAKEFVKEQIKLINNRDDGVL